MSCAPTSSRRHPRTSTWSVGDGTITVGWTAAISDDGSPVKTYRPHDRLQRRCCVVVPGSTTQAVFGGLNNMATQTVSVIATNDVGPGPAGNATAPMQSAGTPPNVCGTQCLPRGPSAAADSNCSPSRGRRCPRTAPARVTYKALSQWRSPRTSAGDVDDRHGRVRRDELCVCRERHQHPGQRRLGATRLPTPPTAYPPTPRCGPRPSRTTDPTGWSSSSTSVSPGGWFPGHPLVHQ